MATNPQPLKNGQKNQDDLLRIIEDGDAEIILSPENSKGFNELVKYELVYMKNEKICLTDLGVKAKTEGATKIIAEMKAKALKGLPVGKKPKQAKKYVLILLSVVLTSIIILFLIFY